MPNSIIVTDLDGTLLDEVTYSHAQALPALHRVAESGIPLILCSSKTRAEIEARRAELDNAHPFISENGGGIFIPRGYFSFPLEAEETDGYQLIRLGTPYPEIRAHFARLREKLHAKVRGFADMSVAEVAALTGLSEDAAVLAMQRDFDEPFIFEGAPDENFLRAIEASGLCWTQGRIFHIMGKHDKGRAVNLLMSFYRQQYGSVTSAGLGDSLNDLPMLMAVDRPVLVRHRDGGYDARIAIPRLLKTQLPGPAGWNEAVRQLLARQNLLDIFDAALAAVDPYNAVLKAVRVAHGQFHAAGAKYDLE
jgi:mannosyl-3-phosphoglycerate phosphatase family protein